MSLSEEVANESWKEMLDNLQGLHAFIENTNHKIGKERDALSVENEQLKDKLSKCDVEREYLKKVTHERKCLVEKEIDKLKGFINSLMTEDQKDICNGEAMEAGEPTLQTPKDWIERLRMFLEERDSLADKVEDLEEEESRLELENKKLKEELEAEKFYSKQLKDCSYEEYCEFVSENKLIKEFEDLKNELGEQTSERLFCELQSKQNKELTEDIKKLEQEVQYHKETAEVAVGLANKFKEDIDELTEQYKVMSSTHTALLKRRNWDKNEREKLKKQIEELKEE